MTMDELTSKAQNSIAKMEQEGKEPSKSTKKLLKRVEKVANGTKRDAPMMKYSFEVHYH
jgi:hypothetical protein